jgi:tetratricopeptide (TPR) repeat protein
LQLDATNPEALIVLGDYQESVKKNYDQAEAYFSRALEQQPGDAKIHQAIAELHLRTGKIETGLHHIQVARKIEPWHRVVRWVETKYLTAMGRLEDALMAAEDLILMHPDFPYIRNFHWQYHLSKGEHDLAISSIPSSSPESSINYMRALTYLDRMDFTSLELLYPQLPEGMHASVDLLTFIQKEEWESAYAELRRQLSEDRFNLIALFQSSDFEMFNKMKSDTEIQRIFAEYGITVHQIPEYLEPEM